MPSLIENPFRNFSLSSILARLNPFRGIDFERDVVGRFGPAFVPRGERLDQPSYFNEAYADPDLQGTAAGVASLHPVAGWLTGGIGAGVLAGVRSGNPYIGLATGVGSLIMGAEGLYKNMVAYNQEKEEKAKQKREKKFYESGIEAFNQFKLFSEGYKKTQEALAKRQEDIENKWSETNKLLNDYLTAQKEKPKPAQPQWEIQRVGDEINEQIENDNSVRAFNNLQIQHLNSFTINGPAVAPRKQVQSRTGVDHYRHKAISTNFFAPA